MARSCCERSDCIFMKQRVERERSLLCARLHSPCVTTKSKSCAPLTEQPPSKLTHTYMHKKQSRPHQAAASEQSLHPRTKVRPLTTTAALCTGPRVSACRPSSLPMKQQKPELNIHSGASRPLKTTMFTYIRIHQLLDST